MQVKMNQKANFFSVVFKCDMNKVVLLTSHMFYSWYLFIYFVQLKLALIMMSAFLASSQTLCSISSSPR